MSCFIIAEAGVNHNGSEEMAFQLVDAAVEVGADAVKFQTFRADELVQRGAEKAQYQKEMTGDGDQHSMLKRLELSEAVHEKLAAYCVERGIEFLSTGFDTTSIDLLVSLGIQRLKIPSGELINKPYVEYTASFDMPIILSTGMSTLAEVEETVGWIEAERAKRGFSSPLAEFLTLLHCTSSYPAPLDSVNLRAMQTLAKHFGLPVGYSDHTSGILVAPASVAMGGTVVEKHFTLDRNLDGPDHKASLEPAAFGEMVKQIRQVEQCLGDGIKQPTPVELDVRKVARRSIVVKNKIPAGHVLTQGDFQLLRPGTGLAPKYLDELVGRELRCELNAGQQLFWEDLK